MTTSDRAGNEERLREALDEAIRLTTGPGNGTTTRRRSVEEWQRLHRVFYEAAAALAATPTQSGAEGPALREALAEIGSDYTILRSTMGGIARDSTVTTLANARAVAERARAETRDWLEFDLAALRSGAEVAVAPGLSEAALVRKVYEDTRDGRVPDPRSTQWAGYVARLTDNPS